jgi:hypothetical protein
MGLKFPQGLKDRNKVLALFLPLALGQSSLLERDEALES